MRRAILALLLTTAIPAGARADRGALTLEAGPNLTWWPRMPPAVGSGRGVAGSAGGGQLALRYGLRNDLDLSVSGFYDAEAPYSHTGVRVEAGGGAFTGTLSSRTTRWGVVVGGRYVSGLVLRFFFGGEVGWAQQRSTRLDLINLSDPANSHSFGLGLASRDQGALILAPLVGVEWQVTDRWSVGFAPRLQVLIGSAGGVAVSLPLSVGYSWFGW